MLASACSGTADMSTAMPEHALIATGLPEVNDQSWDALTGNGWNYLRRTSAKDAEIVADPTAPFSPDRVLRIIFTPDMQRDSEPTVHWIRLPTVREVYAGWWIRLSPNPCAMAPSVLALHGAMIMPAVANDPLEIAAPMSFDA